MDDRLNPRIENVALYECCVRQDSYAPQHARVLFLLSGELRVACAEQTFRLSPDALLYLPQECTFSLRSKGMRAVVVSFDLCTEQNIAIPPFDRVIYMEDGAAQRPVFIQMEHVFSTGTRNAPAAVSALLKGVLVQVADANAEGALPVHMASALDAYIAEHCEEEISNTEIGAVFGYHPFYVSQMLKARAGTTLHRYILEYRLRMARRLLLYTDKTVAQIAQQVGFKDASYFTKTFKIQEGKTPKDYRTSHAQDKI